MMIVHNYKIEKIEPNLNVKEFQDPEIQENIKKLISTREEYVVKIDLMGVSSKISNAIRRTLIDEANVKALDFDLMDLKLNNCFLIRDELRDRIKFLPLNQEIPEDAVFELYACNESTGMMTVYSDEIKNVYGAKNIKNIIFGKSQIAELNHGQFIHIKNIKVISGCGKDHSSMTLTSNIVWGNLDYMDVKYVNTKGNRLPKRVKVSDISKLIKISDKHDIISQKILIIPNKENELALDEREWGKIKNTKYDHIIRSNIEECFSLVHKSSEIYMEIYLLGNMKPELVMPSVCQNLIDRLMSIKNDIEGGSSDSTAMILNKSITSNKTIVNGLDEKQNIWTLCVKNETYTIGEILLYQIYELDKNIPFIKKYVKSNGEYSFYLDMIHKNPKKITLDALAILIKTFEQIKKEV